MNPPPSQPRTFLFTDIQGSTRLWEQHPTRMPTALARHDEILHDSIEANGGAVFKTIGDAFCAVFESAAAGVAAALDAQRRLAAEPWPPEVPVRVRMGLHTGHAVAVGSDFFGPTLNRCARLMGIGHGGQTLLSRAARERLEDALPVGAALRDLATHRLKDLSQPEHVFQLTHPDLADDFPPLASLDTHPHNLPVQLTSFVGRERALAEIRSLAERARLLTLTGAGGSGKTRLALQLGAELQDELVEGPWFIDLAPLSPAPDRAAGATGEVLQAVARALDLREEPGRTIEDTVAARLGGGRQVILLDNCEHLTAAAAAVTARLAQRCPELRVVVTSRERLGVTGEVVWPVPMLTLPAITGPGAIPLEAAMQSEAIELFVARACEAAPGFTLDADTVDAVATICRRLDGIALAIELAAARVRVLSPAQIAERVDQRLRLLTGGSRDLLPRQQTLRALIDWSHDLLMPDEQRLLARLSVFRGGWTLEAAEAMGAGGNVDAWAVLELLTQLVDKSLVVAGTAGDAARYHLLETVREYAAEKLEVAGDADGTRDRHLVWALREAAAGFDGLVGPDQGAWMARLDAEHDNLRAALDRAAVASDPDAGLRLAGSLWRFWFMSGAFSEGRELLGRFLTTARDIGPTPERALALLGAGALAYGQGDYVSARAHYVACLEARRVLGDAPGIAAILNNLAVVARDEGDFSAAQAWFAESLEGFRALGERRSEADVLFNLGVIAIDLGDFAMAEEHLGQAEAIRADAGNDIGSAACRLNLGIVAQLRGAFEEAEAGYGIAEAAFSGAGLRTELPLVYRFQAANARLRGRLDEGRRRGEQSLALCREIGDRRGEALTHYEMGRVALDEGNEVEAERLLRASVEAQVALGHGKDRDAALQWLGRVALRRGDPAEARRCLEESLCLRRAMGARASYAEALEGLCGLMARQGDPALAVALAATAEAARAELGLPLPVRERAEIDGWLASARAALGDAAFEARRLEGLARPVDDVVAELASRIETIPRAASC